MAMSVTYTIICGRIVGENRGGVQKSYVRDSTGNTIALLDNTQTATDTFEYWPYGEVVARTGTTPTPFQFGGTLGYYTGMLSMIYVRARVLMAALGRWLTVDPLWPLLSPYTYAGSNPVTFSDESGWVPVRGGSVFPYGTNAIQGLGEGGSTFGSTLNTIWTFLENCKVCGSLVAVLVAAYPCLQSVLANGVSNPAVCEPCCNAFVQALGGAVGTLFSPVVGALIAALTPYLSSGLCAKWCAPSPDCLPASPVPPRSGFGPSGGVPLGGFSLLSPDFR